MAHSHEVIDPLLFLTVRLGRLVTNCVQNQLGEADRDMIGPNMGILADLMRQDGVRQQDLAFSSLKDKATITRSILSLEKQGLVLRTPDPVDKRTKRIFITADGRKLFHQILPVGHAVLDAAKAGIDTDALATCTRVLKKMYDNLNAPTQRGKAEVEK